MRTIHIPWPGEDYRVIRASRQRGLDAGKLYRVVAVAMTPLYPGMTRPHVAVTLAPVLSSGRLPKDPTQDVEIQTDAFWKFFASIADEALLRTEEEGN